MEQRYGKLEREYANVVGSVEEIRERSRNLEREYTGSNGQLVQQIRIQ